MDLYVAVDGDKIGSRVGRAAHNDDEAGLRRISRAIEHGNEVVADWVRSSGGTVISYGGDEARVRVPAAKVANLPEVQRKYQKAVGATLSVGIGYKLSEGDKALMVAKLRGGNRIVLWTDEAAEEYQRAQEKYKSQGELDKIGDEYLKELPEQKAFTDDPIGKSEDERPEDHGDAAKDFHDRLHELAQATHEKEATNTAVDDQTLEMAKQRVVDALKQIKAKAPQLGQLKQTDPDAYNTLMMMTHSVIDMARSLKKHSRERGRASESGKFRIERVEGSLGSVPEPLDKADMGDPVEGAGDPTGAPQEENGEFGGQPAQVHDNAVNLRDGVSSKEADETARALGIDFDNEQFTLNDFHLGMAVEVEHSEDPQTNIANFDPLKTGKIAWAHLKEDPDYYRTHKFVTEAFTRFQKSEESLEKMAIADIPAGKIDGAYPGRRNKRYDYSHLLPPERRAEGYKLYVSDDGHGLRSNLYFKDMAIDPYHNLSAYLDDDAEDDAPSLSVDYVQLPPALHGKGLGNPLYEAVYAHAYHKHGARYVIGDTHSSMAQRVHESLARKHGLEYLETPRINKRKIGQGTEPGMPPEAYDDAYGPYEYTLKSEESLDKADGAMKRLAPATPSSVEPRSEIEFWQHNGESAKEEIPRMDEDGEDEQNLLKRGLHRLHGLTDVRMNPTTNEREFLMWRAAHPYDVDFESAPGKVSIPSRSSWSPDSKYVNENFWDPDSKSEFLGAWIPQSSIVSIPHMYGNASGAGSNPFREEREHIVEPGKYDVHSHSSEQGLDKSGIGNLPMPGAPAHHHLNLPVGSVKDAGPGGTRKVGQIKVEHSDGTVSWVQVRDGMIMSQEGHPISSRNPNGR